MDGADASADRWTGSRAGRTLPRVSQQRRVRALVAVAAALAAVFAVTGALAQSEPAETTSAQAFRGLPRYINGFQKWPKVRSFRPMPRRGGDAHPGKKVVYVNKRLSVLAPGGKQRFPYPNGTIVVKTATTEGFVHLVAVGRKIKGTNRKRGDWQFIEWTRDRRDARFVEVARGQVCYSCHVGAKKTDWIFTRIR